MTVAMGSASEPETAKSPEYALLRYNPFPDMHITVLGKSSLVGETGWRLADVLNEKNLKAISVIVEKACFPDLQPGDMQVRTIFAPVPDFSCDFVRHQELTQIFGLSEKVRLVRGRKADRFDLLKGSAGAFATGGCHTLVAQIPGLDGNEYEMQMVHCARDTVIPKGLLLERDFTGAKERGSIIDQMMRPLTPAQREGSRFAIVCGIGPLSFPHPGDNSPHYEINRRRIAYLKGRFANMELWRGCFLGELSQGNLSMPHIIFLELLRWGVPIGNIWHDGVDAGTDERLYCHSKPGDGRNLVLALNPGW
ncbi:MAG: hypothetical protein AAB597_02435 [Patescibacteria group bacterium]